MVKNRNILYEEKVTSTWTVLLFVALMVLFLCLGIWRVSAVGWDALAVILAVLACVFLFYSLNYRVLVIRFTAETLVLRFGFFSYRVPWENIKACSLDEIPAFIRYGGAGIHFMMLRGRYRVSFNFLEHPRVEVVFKKKAWLVQDLSFTTRHPDEVIRIVRENVT